MKLLTFIERIENNSYTQRLIIIHINIPFMLHAIGRSKGPFLSDVKTTITERKLVFM